MPDDPTLTPAMAYAASFSSTPSKGGDWRSTFDSLAQDLETRFGYKKEYSQRQLGQESGGNRKAKSWAGASGLMQLMPGTARRYGVKDTTDPIQNLKGWHAYMSDLLTRFNGDHEKAVAAYNAGEGAVSKYGVERVRKFSNLPKGDKRRGTTADKTTTGDYVNKILGRSGLEDIDTLNKEFTTPTKPIGEKERSSLVPSRGESPAMAYARAQTPTSYQAEPMAPPPNRMTGAKVSAQAEVKPQPSSYIEGIKQSFDEHPWIERQTQSLGEGVAESTAGMLDTLAGGEHLIAETAGDPLSRFTARKIGDYVAKGSSYLKTRSGESRAQHPPESFMEDVGQGVLRGAAGAPITLAALAAGGPLGAANMPLQMGLAGYETGGVKGLAKGAALGLVYHFGMGFTAPLGRIKNALIWGAGATGEGLVEGETPGAAIASGITMGALSAMGGERVKIDGPNGKPRFATVKDLVAIQRGFWDKEKTQPVVVSPPDSLLALRDKARGEVDSAIQGGGYHNDTPAQAYARNQKQGALDKVEEFRQQRLAKLGQEPEAPVSEPLHKESQAPGVHTAQDVSDLKEYHEYFSNHPVQRQGLATVPEASAKNFFRILGQAVDRFRPELAPTLDEAHFAWKAGDFNKATQLTNKAIYELHRAMPSITVGGVPVTLESLKKKSEAAPVQYNPAETDVPSNAAMFHEQNMETLRKGLVQGRVDVNLFNTLHTSADDYHETLRKLAEDPRFDKLSVTALHRIAQMDEAGQTLLAEAIAPKVPGTKVSIYDPSLSRTSQKTLETMANAPEIQRLTHGLLATFDAIQKDLAKDPNTSEHFANARLDSIQLGDTGVHAWNTRADMFSDGVNRISLNMPSLTATTHAMWKMGWVEGNQYNKAIAIDAVETMYHELYHQVDEPGRLPSGGHEGHGPEWDAKFHAQLERHAENVLRYAEALEKELDKGNDEIVQTLGQHALDSGLLQRFEDLVTTHGIDPFNSARKARTSAVLAGLSGQGGAGLGEAAPGHASDSRPGQRIGTDQFPLYKASAWQRTREWSERRRNNLERFMGEKSIFRKPDGEFEPVFHGTDQDFTEFRKGDIGFHVGTSRAATDIMVSQGRVEVKGPGYSRIAGKKEYNFGRPANAGEEFTSEGTPNVLPLFAKLENPADVEDVNNFSNSFKLGPELLRSGYITKETYQRMLDLPKAEHIPFLRQELEIAGYDGLKYTNVSEDSGSTSYVVFHPEQLKSAIGNSGEFDPYDPNILHSSDPVSMAVQSAIRTGQLLYKAGVKFVDWSKQMVAKFGPGIKLHLDNLWEAAVHFHSDERGFINVGGKQFLYQDVAPAAKKTGIALQSNWDGLLKLFAPGARGADAKEMAGALREGSSKLWLKYFRTEHALESARTILDKVATPDKWKFIDEIETGAKQSNPELQPIADVMRRLLDEGRFSVQRLGTGKLQNFYQDYFPHIWKDPQAAQQIFSSIFSKRPLAGKKSFLKERTYMTFKEGLNAGLTPISDNPVDLVLLKLHEVNKYVMGVRIMQELKVRGLAKFVKSNKIELEKRNGYVEVNDSIASVFGGGSAKPQGGMLLRGKYMVPEVAGKVINNYLSPGLRGNAGFRGYMMLANTLNQFQLGISMFHAGFTTLDAGISKAALGVDYLMAGKPLKAMAQWAQVPVSPLTNIYRGHQVMKEALTPGYMGGAYTEIVKALTAGGFRPKMEKVYGNDMVHKMQYQWKQGNKPGAILRSPMALTEWLAKPVLEKLVPRQKLGVAADMVRFELDRNPNMSQQELRATMGKVVDSIDNRLGQMTYDNLFWNRTVKDLAMFSVRSVGWNLGTFREIGGGITDATKVPIDLLRGQGLNWSHRSSYVVALPVMVGMLGAVTQYLYTGKGPEEVKDYFFPRTGNLDERGNPERVNLPSYIKDLYHYRDAYKLGPQTRKTLASKLHPAVAIISNIINNEDYFGTEVHHWDDSWAKQAGQVGKFAAKSALPFGIQNFMKEKERGASTPKALVPLLTGITPAPSDINSTPAEEELYWYNQATRPQGTRTQAEADRIQAKSAIRGWLRKKQPDEAMKTAQVALKKGVITEDDIQNVLGSLDKSPLQIRFAGTNPEEAFKAWTLMSDKEKGEVKDLMRTKAAHVLDLPAEEREGLIPKFKTVIEYYKKEAPK